MQLLDTLQQVLATGVLPITTERKIQRLMQKQRFNEVEIAAIEELLDALCTGRIRPVF
jgi:hypothetical protein